MAGDGDVASTAIIGLLTFVLLALIAAKVGAGKNWARWLFAAIYLIGLLGIIATVALSPAAFVRSAVALQISTAAQFALQTAALWLLFTGTAREWFDGKKAAALPADTR